MRSVRFSIALSSPITQSPVPCPLRNAPDRNDERVRLVPQGGEAIPRIETFGSLKRVDQREGATHLPWKPFCLQQRMAQKFEPNPPTFGRLVDREPPDQQGWRRIVSGQSFGLSRREATELNVAHGR